jgi:hypothetical protein
MPVTDERLGEAIRAADPYRDLVIPPPSATAAQLRARAESLAPETAWDRFLQSHTARRGVLVAASLAIGAAVTGYVLRPTAAIAAPGLLDIDFRQPATPARDWLVSLARSLPAESVPAQADAGPTTFAHYQRWSMDTINPASELVAQDVQVSWRADRSGDELVATLPPQTPGRSTAEFLDRLPPGTQQQSIKYAPGEFSDLIGTPSASPPELKAQLEQQEPSANGPQATVRALADVAAIHHLGVSQRIAALLVLADVPGLASRGVTRDRAGRPCTALSVDSGNTESGLVRDVLLIDAAGTILGHEIIALTPPPRSRIPKETVIEYTLSLRTERRQ